MSHRKYLKIATRKSPLAIWQATHIKNLINNIHPHLSIKLVPVITKGDIILDKIVLNIGGKSVFVKELEQLILKRQADLAVHSIKDLPAYFPEGLGLVSICKRDIPHDVFVSNNYCSIEDLPNGAIIGTSSLRRKCQIISYRPDLLIRSIRGNIGTRLNKLDEGEYDAIILAAAGLKRLGLENRISQILPTNVLLPAVGQGAIGVECCLDDSYLINLLQLLNHEDTAVCIKAERAMNTYLQGGCELPVASFAILEGNDIWLRGLIGKPDGSMIIKKEVRGSRLKFEEIGISLAKKLLISGGKDFFEQIIFKYNI
ncbi:hydroxymethylbilane synthase [Candidatus Pantoea edessiphila]|uniref:Porphobilinogen deaminase n=1 Tax=Candidatus Pantoea edessiphila TaxID=2044610 RepID=A0A2P5SVC8_9GAMM|nr:hydroxymethylbilane synthase [Candidatus Pantoea edessiphila]PPI86278.1 hydroxymethylbilane synthase [Candidatus Pantoea edessiphila]